MRSTDGHDRRLSPKHGRLSRRPGVRLAACSAMSLAVWLSAGCANQHGQLVGFLRSNEQVVSAGQYVVMPPDAITIHAPISPEIDGVATVVRPDGKIALRLLGEVDIAGLTTEQIAEKLQRHLARYYVEPEVVVDVARYGSQVYYVFGEVARPGPKTYTGRDALLTVLADAAPTFLAWRQQIRVTRPSPDGSEPKTVIVNLDEMVHSGDAAQNILLQPGDIVQVPPSPLAWLGLRVRELLYPVEPVIQAYDAPATPIDATHIYQDEISGNGDREGSRARRSFGVLR
jgi:polysaccharide biosynthesis/export protein